VEACALAAELGAGDFRCVHMSHLLPWDLPHTGRDGETFSFPD
jgi:phosphoribosyl 1,2-cyclic phosphate phosphodiesterase